MTEGFFDEVCAARIMSGVGLDAESIARVKVRPGSETLHPKPFALKLKPSALYPNRMP